MKIPYALRPRPVREPATGLLVPGTRAQDVFDLVAHLRLAVFPAVFATSEGFLIKLPSPHERLLAGVICLRSLADNLFLPVGADLVPPLLPDEAQGLVRSRGLVFLPHAVGQAFSLPGRGARALEFVPDHPLSWGDLLQVPSLHVADWRSLPEPKALADELLELTSTVPPPAAELILDQGRSDIGSESPRPAGAPGIGSRLAGAAAYMAGSSLAWLGTKLGLGGLAGMGASMLERALDFIPRLSERLMGEQEAALRDLLRDFRDGNIERALRRALPLNQPESNPVAPSVSAQLPRHNLFYSLQNLLKGRHNPGGLWFTPNELFHALQAEYRQQAEAAARRGDYRRAAFIHAKLLGDLGAAAHILSQGGLHRDAALIYQSLSNLHAAALQWQAAGEIDKAVEILVQLGADLEAAEILRKVGEPQQALVHYRRAAQKLTAQKKYFEAGELFLTRAQRPDLALTVFHDGWQSRPSASALPCGLALARHFADEPNPPRFVQILADAEKCLSIWTVESKVNFVNHLARLAKRPGLTAVAGAAQDRCLMSLVDQMRQTGIDGNVGRAVSRYFPGDSPWPAPVARDAQFALNALLTNRARDDEPTMLVRLGNSIVSAVCFMPFSMDLFLGFANGEVIRHRLATRETRCVLKQTEPIVGLQADPEEHHLVALAGSAFERAYLFTGTRSGAFHLNHDREIRAGGRARFCATVANQASPFFGVLSADRCQLFRRDNPSWSLSLPHPANDIVRAALVGSLPTYPETPWCLQFFGERGVFLINQKGGSYVWRDVRAR